MRQREKTDIGTGWTLRKTQCAETRHDTGTKRLQTEKKEEEKREKEKSRRSSRFSNLPAHMMIFRITETHWR
jgi:hypothetical protein